jgi:tyrosyl-tRNA synthetase
MSDFISEITWRGLLNDATEGTAECLGAGPTAMYIGFDPTSDSLHVGHIVGLMVLARLQRFGHTPIALAGGGTGMIGDPSGRSAERNLLTPDQIQANTEKIKLQLAHFLDFGAKANPAKLLNNADWLSKLSMIDYLRDVGKHFSVNMMLGKDSVKSRLAGDTGISYTEFSYMLLQAYDFLHLYKAQGCKLQAGGSDQWGNIVAGTDLIRRATAGRAYGVTYPLITKSDGTKFGKTADGAVWLDPNRTSPYRFYQFWINADDSDVVKYLKFFTWLNEGDIGELERATDTAPQERAAQQRLAEEMTRLVHGDAALHGAKAATKVLFGGSLEGMSGAQIADIFSDAPATEVSAAQFAGDGMAIADLLVSCGLASSKGDARRALEGKGIALNNTPLGDGQQKLTLDAAIDRQYLVLRKGKKNYALVKIT